MPKDTAIPPQITQSGGAQNIQAPIAKETSTAGEATMRQWTGNQTIIAPMAQ